MPETYTTLIKNRIAEQLINTNFDPASRNADQFLFSNKQIMFEQYKLLVDSAHKAEERRGVSNNIFLGINGLLASFFVFPEKLINIQIKDLPASLLFAIAGMFISWEWIKVIASYKKINFINYSLIKSFEQFFSTYVFSLKGEIELEHEEEKPNNAGSIILKKENFLPKAFFVLYFIYFVLILACFLNNCL